MRISDWSSDVCSSDLDWANSTVVPTFSTSVRNAATRSGLSNVKILDLQSSLNGRRLCENTVGLLEEKGVASWTSAGAVDKTEWVKQLRTTSTVFGPDRKCDASGKGGAGRVDPGGRRPVKQKKK